MNIQLAIKHLGKSTLAEAANIQAAEIIESGDLQKAWVNLKKMEEFIDVMKSCLVEHVINATSETCEIEGAKIVNNQRREYGYDHDGKWVQLKKAEAQASEARKAHEKVMLSIPSEVADTMTGEVIQPAKLLGVKSVLTTTLPK